MIQRTTQPICSVVSINDNDDDDDDDDDNNGDDDDDKDDDKNDDDDDADDDDDKDDDVSAGNGVSPLVPAQNWEAPAFNKRMEAQLSSSLPSSSASSPSSSSSSSSSLSRSDGELYTATVSDFSGSDPLIYKEPLRTEQYDSKILNSESTHKYEKRNIKR